MIPIFTDTSYYLALANPRDRLHEAALDFSNGYRGALVTTEYVLVEVGNFMHSGGFRSVYLSLVNQLRDDPKTRIVPAGKEFYDQALGMFASRPDKNWSLTDCASFVVMRQLGLTQALTADRHFKQAGFHTILKEPDED
jgi:hypothetical protein